MDYRTILVKKSSKDIIITFNRLKHQNSINETLLKELNDVLDFAEKDEECKMIVLKGQQGIFCTGMDFEAVADRETQATDVKGKYDSEAVKKLRSSSYLETIKRFTLMPKVIISAVDGRAMAGGIGLVAASDLVISTSESQFSLSEALWGLLPAIVTPYLIRRVGFQAAYRMTLTTIPITAQEAYRIGLVDEVSENVEESIKKYWLRLSKLETSTILNIKQYFRKMWMITDELEETSILENLRLSNDPEVIKNIVNYVKYQKLPWDLS